MGDKALPVAHYIRPNHKSRTPARHIYFDTEANIEGDEASSDQTWKLAVAAFDLRASDNEVYREREWGHFLTPEDLWQWVGDRTSRKGRTVVWAHNLGYDLRISRALDILPEQGWSLETLRLGGRDAVARFVRDGHSLLLTDLHAWAPVKLDHVGRLLGLEKPELPRQVDDLSLWWARCEADVTILAAAARHILAWNRANDVGNFQPTGAGQAWSTWRHKFYTHKLLVHDDQDARTAERQAVHAGRCEVWRHGTIRNSRITEMDWTTAYAQVARDVNLPTRLLASYQRPSTGRILRRECERRILARVIMHTEAPVVPARVAGRLCWPVGTFTTTLWDNELDAALAAGATFEPCASWEYRAEPLLRDWALWALDVLTRERDPGAALTHLIIKQQTRTLIGRFGLRYPEWVDWGQALPGAPTLGVMTTPEHPEGRDMLSVGGRVRVQTDWVEAPDAAPQVLGYVMAEVRTRLWRWMNAAGLENVLYVDTDGMILTAKGQRNLEGDNPDALRSKGSHSGATLRGPRQVILGERVKISGVPSNATPTGDVTYKFDAWESLRGGLRNGRPGSVRVREREVSIPGVDFRRRHLNGGLTAPFRVTIDSVTGENMLAETN